MRAQARINFLADWTRSAVMRCLTSGRAILRPFAPTAGYWKNFPNANWGFALHGLACEAALRYSPDPWGTRFAHCPMCGLMYGDGFDVWADA